MKFFKIARSMRICNLHFERNCFNKETNTLLKHAAPTIFKFTKKPKDVPFDSQVGPLSTFIARSTSNATNKQHSVTPLDQLSGTSTQKQPLTFRGNVLSLKCSDMNSCFHPIANHSNIWAILIDDVLRFSFPFPHLSIGYADDLTISTSHKIPELATRNLQLICNAISSWCSDTKLSLNAQKTIFMLLNKQRLNVSHLSISIYDVHIHPSVETVFLGLTIDSQLKWASHFNAKAMAARKSFYGEMNCLRASWGLDRKRIQFIYLSVIEPILLYGCSLWASLLNTKAGCKKARSCQRIFLVSAIDGFSAASLKWLSKFLPHIKSQCKVDTFNHFSASKCLPWASFLDAILDDGGATMPMIPSAPQQLRLLTGHQRIENSMHFCVLIMDYCGVRDIVNGSLDPYVDEPTAIQFCTQKALQIASQLGRLYKSSQGTLYSTLIKVALASRTPPAVNAVLLSNLRSISYSSALGFRKNELCFKPSVVFMMSPGLHHSPQSRKITACGKPCALLSTKPGVSTGAPLSKLALPTSCWLGCPKIYLFIMECEQFQL
ncbi:Uncharacterized protein APZ42_013885 [Daphnia magna]|uniref:Reverse transcriptase domain-containing protein n=1 Tax=Daphnia magna TaxID=35525 RepID=A0A162QE81_9CRUS|nr:Uncharacterized protein APZ42_013885 [Daphnia magna]